MRSLFPGNPITKKCGAILELDTLEFASGKKRGRVVVSERHLGEIEHNLCTSVSISSLSVFTHSMCTRPQTRNTISLSPPTTRSILKVIGSHPATERRNTCLARNNLDFVAATVMPASSAISFIEAPDR